MNIPTPHNEAKKGDIAKTVIMPGDPLRAKYIAENFLDDVYCYNKVRNMLGYTGKYNGIEISVQGSGMGIPSMGIYSRELFEGYEVNNIIRIGTCGSLGNPKSSKIANSVELKDIIVAKSVDTDSNYLVSSNLEGKILPECSTTLLDKLESIAEKLDIKINIGKIFTSDVFYKDISGLIELSKSDILGVEMETLALYANAKALDKNAIALYTVSDNIILNKEISSNERENGLNKMIDLALNLAYECEK